ncbi:Myc-type, basic helix-loop-helix (bHLH) domain-containing protein [Artemisia annua]|uniref:Myc-type, basic helix-loop-helix (BHLH) domain-containing protein n=1 Tax=Artemisia annua TaxID=35608 RepID=A0A2U1P0B3_ARTAN|nr:Myc-type, basic helix-loop-helix (bHLH) domain-containing protein [Artemisia annua]
MSSRSSRTAKNRDGELDNLVLKLQALLPATSCSSNKIRVPASKILQETCNYIKSLRTKGDDLGEKLSQLLDSMENNGVDVNIIRDLLQQ